jgi:hypothetical protein
MVRQQPLRDVGDGFPQTPVRGTGTARSRFSAVDAVVMAAD